MAPYFEADKGPLKGSPLFAHATDGGENAQQNHKAAEELARAQGITLVEKKDSKGKPCTELPNKYTPTGPVVKT